MARAYAWSTLLIALSLFGCKEEIIISGQDALVDPRFLPRMIFSQPPMNSTGPYALWNSPDYYGMHLRFNKLMNRGSLRKGLRLSSNLRALDAYSYEYADNELSEKFTLYPVDSGGYSWAAPQIGELMTLSVGEPIEDVNGNILPPGIIGTLRPEPYFRVRRTIPADGETLPTLDGELFLVFNSKVDSTIRRYITTDPPASIPWRISQYDSTLVQLPLYALRPSMSYTVAVAAGATDARGHVMSVSVAATFHSPTFSRVNLLSLYDTTEVPLNQQFHLFFSLPVDPSSVRRAFHIVPDVEEVLRMDASYDRLTIIPATDYEPLTRYSVAIDTSLRSTSGFRLSRPVSFSFTTDRFRVSRTIPGDKITGASIGDDLRVYCSARLDTSTIRKSFRISPPAEGMFFPSVGETGFTFYLADPLQTLTTYTVTIDTSIRSSRGLRLDAPYGFTFTTIGR